MSAPNFSRQFLVKNKVSFKFLYIIIFPATTAFLQQNITVLIGERRSTTPACALSTVTGIPLVRLHGNSMPLEHCEKTVDMSAEYTHFAHATYDLVNRFSWKKISLIFDGNQLFSLS